MLYYNGATPFAEWNYYGYKDCKISLLLIEINFLLNCAIKRKVINQIETIAYNASLSLRRKCVSEKKKIHTVFLGGGGYLFGKYIFGNPIR